MSTSRGCFLSSHNPTIPSRTLQKYTRKRPDNLLTSSKPQGNFALNDSTMLSKSSNESEERTGCFHLSLSNPKIVACEGSGRIFNTFLFRVSSTSEVIYFHVQGNLFPEPPPPPPTSRLISHMVPNVNDEAHKHLIITSMTIMGCMLGAALLFCILCTVFKIYYSRRRNSRRMESTRMIFGTQNSFPDGNQGYVVDHPIWYINTVGLQQSVIESIAVFKYNKDEGLIEGTDCSVCLSEFEEDESLRLLPKCNHAFHLPCIDTWLRSHKNCPLCRAPILCENFDGQAVSLVPMGADLGSTEESQIETYVNHGGLISNRAVEDGTSEVRSGDDNVVALPHVDESVVENLKMGYSHNVLRSHSRMLSDFVGTREATEPEMQPLRRSMSLDSSSASVVYSSVANIVPAKQANLDTQVEQLKNLKSKRVSKRGNSGSSSFRKLIKSSSIGISLQKGPLSMKRSSSSSGKSSSSRYNRSRDSILPL